MLLYARLKERLTQAMKASDTNAKNAVRALLSRLQTSGQETDEAVISSVKMLIKQNEEEIETRNGRVAMPDGSIKEVAVSGQENEIARIIAQTLVFKEFLPDFLSVERIKEILTMPLHQTQINAAKNSGAATGVAMKILKPHGAVEGGTVKDVVTAIYGQ